MQIATHHSPEVRQAATGPSFVPLDRETREVMPTADTAHHLNRRPQTLRGWACSGNGPLTPLHLNGRLAWKTSDVRRLVGADR